MKHSTTTPTKEEQAWMDACSQYGCCVCREQGRGFVPPAIHHILSGGIRLGHLFTIPLCDPGHHQNAPHGSGEVSRHPFKAEFERRYGNELDLLARMSESPLFFGLRDPAKTTLNSKVAPRRLSALCDTERTVRTD